MADPASWDLLDEDCSDISDWADADAGAGVSQVNPAGQFEFDSGNNLGDYGRRTRVIGSIPNTFTLEIKVYHDALGLRTDADYGRFYVRQADEHIAVYFCSDGLFLRDTDSGYTEVGTDLVKQGGSAEWQTWRFLVTFTGTTGEGTCDVYLSDSTHNWEKVGTAVPCSMEEGDGDGGLQIDFLAETTTNRISHTDYIKIASGLYIPSPEVEDNAVFFGANF